MNEEETVAWNAAIKKALEEIETYSFMWARRIKTAAANGSEDVVAKHFRDAAIRIYGAVKALESPLEENKFHPVFEFLLARIASNPEEFTARPSRWTFAITEAGRIGSPEEKRALEAAINELNKNTLYENIMGELMGNKDGKENATGLRSASSTPSYGSAHQRALHRQQAEIERDMRVQQALMNSIGGTGAATQWTQSPLSGYPIAATTTGTHNPLSRFFGGKK